MTSKKDNKEIKKIFFRKKIIFSEYSLYFFILVLNILKNIDQSDRGCRGPKTLRVFCTRNNITKAVVQIQVIAKLNSWLGLLLASSWFSPPG